MSDVMPSSDDTDLTPWLTVHTVCTEIDLCIVKIRLTMKLSVRYETVSNGEHGKEKEEKKEGKLKFMLW